MHSPPTQQLNFFRAGEASQLIKVNECYCFSCIIVFVVQFTDCFDATYNGLKITQSTLKLVMMDHGSEVEDESFRESQSETQFEIELRVTPLLSFTSGSAFGNHSDNNNILTEPLRPVNLGKVAESGRHNSKKANTLKKPETSSDSEKGKKEELKNIHSRQLRVHVRFTCLSSFLDLQQKMYNYLRCFLTV